MNTPISTPEARLRGLGLRVPIALVREAAQRLRNGESLYALYKPAKGPPLVAKGTTEKIKRFLDQGKLGFLLDTHVEEEAVEEIVQGAGWMHDPPDLGSESALINRLEELRPHLPRVEWNIEVLESVGIPATEDLELLIEHDLLMSRMSEWSLNDLRRFVAIYYIAEYYRQESNRGNPAPPEVIMLAAETFAHGAVDDNRVLMDAGRNLLRYQVWRGSPFLEAYRAAQEPHMQMGRRMRQQLEEKLAEVRERIAAIENDEEGKSNG